jgi:hypothetical protein
MGAGALGAADRRSGGGEGSRKKGLRAGVIDRTLRAIAKGGLAMRYLAVALALAFAVGTMSVAQACPDNMMKTASQVASTDGQTAPPSTKARIPTPPKG